VPTPPTNARRAYRSQVRDTQARATRRAIVTAATELFVERGYAATTIDAVAERAGVGRKTVFTSVGGKPELLKKAWDWSLAGDDEPVPMAQRPRVRQIQEQGDPVVGLRLWAGMVREAAARAAPIARVVAAAADVDGEVAALLAQIEQERLGGATMFVHWLRSVGGLRRGLSVQRAAESCWVFMDAAVYGRLVMQRGWSDDEYEHWVAQTVGAAILSSTGPDVTNP
jgi:AcrR family transcriptional regulator